MTLISKIEACIRDGKTVEEAAADLGISTDSVQLECITRRYGKRYEDLKFALQRRALNLLQATTEAETPEQLPRLKRRKKG